jgi:RNA polymerase sigma-70 factor (ECF subfamily)
VEFFNFDKDYVDRLRKGDVATEHHFVAYFEQLLRIKLRAKMLPATGLEDLRQETFVRVIAALRRDGGVRQPERFAAFVNSICNNTILDYYRSSAKNQPMEDVHTNIPDKTSHLEDMLVTKQASQRVRSILDGMPKKDRDLLRAIFLDEREKDDICREMGVDRDYMRVLLKRTKRAFNAKVVSNAEQFPNPKEIPNATQPPGAKVIPDANEVSSASQASSAAQVSPAEQIPSAEQEKPNHNPTPPGATLYSIAEFMCSKRTMEEVVIPLLADMQFEHNEAFSAGRKLEATWVRVRGCWSFFTALGINRLVGMFVRLFLRLSSR